MRKERGEKRWLNFETTDVKIERPATDRTSWREKNHRFINRQNAWS